MLAPSHRKKGFLPMSLCSKAQLSQNLTVLDCWIFQMCMSGLWKFNKKNGSLNTQQQNKLHIFRKSPPAPNPQLTKSDPKFLKKMLSGTEESSQHQSKPQP
jgi:hypothetical protein